MLWNNEWLVCDCMSTPYIYSSHRYLWLHVVNIDVCDCMSTQIESSQNVWLKLSHFSRPYIKTYFYFLFFSLYFYTKIVIQLIKPFIKNSVKFFISSSWESLNGYLPPQWLFAVMRILIKMTTLLKMKPCAVAHTPHTAH